MKNMRLLIVEDEIDNLNELRAALLLHEDVEIVAEANSGKTGWIAFEDYKPDVVFVDIEMETRDAGLLLAEQLSLKSKPPYIVFVTIREDLGIKASNRYHPAAFLTKPWDDAELAQTLQWIRQQEARREADEQKVLTDPLTGLWNRRAYDEKLADEIEKAHRYHSLSLLIIDVDKFKTINDTFGHHAGDEVLKKLAHLMRDNVRKVDYVFRLGGDEFAILLPNTTLDDAQKLANDINTKIENANWPNRRVAVSIGAAQLQPGQDAVALYKQADDAQYHTKETSRNSKPQ